jgi:hypothetical protein
MTEMMEQLPPAWYRARIELYRQLQTSLDKDSGELKLVRNGVFPPERDEKAAVAAYLRQNRYPDTPLSFTELCTYNTWFRMHPQKVCGTEHLTSSREFPITIRGDRKTIENTIRSAIRGHNPSDAGSLELQALALEVELQLLEL